MAASESTLLIQTGGRSTGAESRGTSSNAKICGSFLFLTLSFLLGACLGVAGMYFVPTTSLNNDGTSTSMAATKTKKTRNSKYTATQFVSFSINTMGGVAAYGECEGRIVDQDGFCYLGNATDLRADVERRFEIVAGVIQALADDAESDMPKIDHSPNVLKIFMVPEFYWRGPNGAYSTKNVMQEGGLLTLIADRIYKLIEDERYQDWLFVLGTVIVAQSPNDPRKPWEVEDQNVEEGDIFYFNFAPLVKGGPDLMSNRYEIYKNYISTADFLNRTGGLPDPRKSLATGPKKYNNLFQDEFQEMLEFISEDRGVQVDEDGIVEIDGIRFGLEICLDHAMGVLWDKMQQNNEGLVDVHLIVSAGMSIQRGPVPVVPGGVAYLTDGEASSAACQRTGDSGENIYDPDSVCREGPLGLKHVPNLHTPKYSSYIPLVSCVNPNDATWKPLVNGYYSNYATQGCAYTLKTYGMDVYDEMDFYPPSVEIYPTIDLP